ncbi:MAG: class II aldolase/adducin family protein [Myxococcaceae bacterium]|nr:class II aldolase/adducin family protein [Myxococcaceae bacterium]
MPSAPLPKVRAELVQVSRRLHQNGWVANHDGNVSVRLTGDRFLITPTAVSKGSVDDGMLLVVDAAGKVLEGRRKPFGELDLHLAIYRGRPEVDAVVHAHPPYATALGLTGQQLSPIALPEMVVSLGNTVPTLPRAMPKDAAQNAALEKAAGLYDAALLQGNGVFSWGPSLELALLRHELVEHCAKILHLAKAFGPVPPLGTAEEQKLLEARAKAGLGPKPRK